jgi:IS30 family transposase
LGEAIARAQGIEFSGASQDQLDDIADQINNRPRKDLGVRSPLTVNQERLLNSPRQSTPVH